MPSLSSHTLGSTFRRQPKRCSTGELQCALVHADHPLRANAEAFIAQRFDQVHEAQVSRFMPLLLVLHDGQQRIRSAIGVRDASQEPLYLEHYLDEPVDRAIALKQRPSFTFPQRRDIVEVGNLASIDRHATRELFRLLALFMIRHRFRWIVFTGCASLRRSFEKMRLPLLTLGRANQAQLPANQQSWGRYYEDDPLVMAGEVHYGSMLASQTTLELPKEG